MSAHTKGAYMAYFCKKCGVPVYIKLSNGVIEMAVERGDKLLPVDKCPICDNPFNSRDDLNYIPPKEEKP